MAQSGYTPILIYASGTASNVPSASNLTTGASGAELALNYADGKLFYKDGSGVVQTLASKSSVSATVSSVSFTGGVISVANPTTTPALTVAGTSGGIPYFSSASTWASSGALTANALVLGGGAGAAPAVLGSLGTTSTVLHGNASGAPTFGAVALASDVSGTLPIGNGGTGLTATPANGQLDIGNGTGFTRTTLTAGSGVLITNGAGSISISATGSGGTVTSVSGTSPVSVATGTSTPVISLASGYGDTQNPYASKTANYILATPNGTAGTPTFRALVAADIPTLPGSQISGNISGNAANVTGTVAIGNGGTGLTTFTAGDLIYFSSGTTFTKLGIGTAGQYLTVNSGATAPQWTTAVASGVTSFQTSMAGLTPSAATTGSVTLAGTLGPANGGTGVANNALSTLTISGAFGTTLTVSGTTAITLPTSGTLSTLAGSETLTNKTLTNPTITNYTETLQAVGTVGASSTLSLTSGTVLTATLTSATACTFTMPTATAGKSFILILTQPASGTATTATFTGVKWPAGTAPTITATLGAVDILSFVANGSVWYGTASQAFA